jgi:hypothetical protein
LNSRSLLKFALVTVLFSGAGCGKSIQPAGGKVLVDGVPVKDGAVTFYPVEPGRAASASVMEDGSFTLSFDSPNDGLPPGDYKVTIVADVWKDTVSPEQKKALEAVLKKQGAIDDPALLSAGTLIHIVPHDSVKRNGCQIESATRVYLRYSFEEKEEVARSRILAMHLRAGLWGHPIGNLSRTLCRSCGFTTS